MGENFTRDRLPNQFEPLSRIRTTEDQLAWDNRVANGNNISAFNSSTTLSSIFRLSTTLNSIFTSTTTLSSIASSQTSPQIQPAGGDLCDEVEEESIGAFWYRWRDYGNDGHGSKRFLDDGPRGHRRQQIWNGQRVGHRKLRTTITFNMVEVLRSSWSPKNITISHLKRNAEKFQSLHSCPGIIPVTLSWSSCRRNQEAKNGLHPKKFNTSWSPPRKINCKLLQNPELRYHLEVPFSIEPLYLRNL